MKYGKHISKLFSDDTLYFIDKNKVRKLTLDLNNELFVHDPKDSMYIDGSSFVRIYEADADSWALELLAVGTSFKVQHFYSTFKDAQAQLVEEPSKLETDINLILTHTLAPVPITTYNAMTMLVSKSIEKYSWCFPNIAGIEGKRVAKLQFPFKNEWIYLIEHFGSFRVLDTSLNELPVENPNDPIYKILMEDYVKTIIEKSSPTTDRAIIKVYEMLQGK